jgi:hypothetical protein
MLLYSMKSVVIGRSLTLLAVIFTGTGILAVVFIFTSAVVISTSSVVAVVTL